MLRGLVLAGSLAEQRAAQASIDLRDLPAKRWPAGILLERMWMLRANVTAYDATYLALAETLEAELLTADAKLARAVDGIAACPIVVVE